MNRNDLISAIVKIYKGPGTVVGTGFVVSRNLIATCAHVVLCAGKKPGQTVQIRFLTLDSAELIDAVVVEELWREAEDIAFLRFRYPLPPAVKPVTLADSRDLENKTLFGYGFPENETHSGLGARVLVVTKLHGGDSLQLQSQEITKGYSGGPLLDEEGGAVVGLIQAIRPMDRETGRHSQTAFAIPAKTLTSVCPELRPHEAEPDKDLRRVKIAEESIVLALAMVFVDIMRLLCVLSGERTRAANMARYQEFLDVTHRHFGDLRACVTRFAGALDTESNHRGHFLERRLSFVLGRIEEKGPPSAPVGFRQYFDIMLTVAEGLSTLLQSALGARFSNDCERVGVELQTLLDPASAEYSRLSLDDLWRIRLCTQSRVLQARKGTHLTTIADDMDLEVAALYFTIDCQLLPHVVKSLA